MHYATDAESLIIMGDCDETEIHSSEHRPGVDPASNCRFCEVERTVTRVKSQLKSVPNRSALKVAIGFAVPAIEAWYLFGKEHQVGEAQWKVGLQAGRPPFTKPKLKEMVYGSDRASLEHMTRRAVDETRRVCERLPELETAFPADLAYWLPRSGPGVGRPSPKHPAEFDSDPEALRSGARVDRN